jgi:hypothetical protein
MTMPRPKGGYKIGKNRVPGVTTPIGIIWDPGKSKGLLDWATKLALTIEDGELRSTYHEWVRDRAGLEGSVAHAMCTAYATDTKQSVFEYVSDPLWGDEESFARCDALYSAFVAWWNANKFTIVRYEEPVINVHDQYGGTPDFIGEKVIADIKTGFVDEYSCCLQLAAYAEAYYWETGFRLGGLIIGFSDNGTGKSVKTYEFTAAELQEYYPDFVAIKKIYQNKNRFKKERDNEYRGDTKQAESTEVAA